MRDPRCEFPVVAFPVVRSAAAVKTDNGTRDDGKLGTWIPDARSQACPHADAGQPWTTYVIRSYVTLPLQYVAARIGRLSRTGRLVAPQQSCRRCRQNRWNGEDQCRSIGSSPLWRWRGR